MWESSTGKLLPKFSIPTYSSEKIVYLDVEKIMQESIAGKAIISHIIDIQIEYYNKLFCKLLFNDNQDE